MKRNYYLMLTALVFLLLGCREELDYLDHENPSQNPYNFTNKNVSTKILHQQDYAAKSFLKPGIENVTSFLKQQHAPSSAFSKDNDLHDDEIYTDVFEEVNYLNATYYSFYIIGTGSDEYEKKLILKYVDSQPMGKYIFTYKRLNDFRADPNSFRLEKLVSSPSSGNENSLTTSEISLSVGCTNYTITTFNCGHDGNHSNGQYCDVDEIRMPYDVVSSVYTANCQPGNSGEAIGSPGDGSGTGTPTGGGSVEGGAGNDQTPEIITLPTTAPLYIIQRPKGIICNTLNLNPEEIVQINSNYEVRLRLYQYLALSGIDPQLCNGIMTPEAEEFVKAALAYFKEHPNANWEDYSYYYAATPCEKVKAQFTRQKYKNKVDSINKSSFFKLKHETGFMEDNTGNLTDLQVSPNTQDGMEITYGQSSIGYTHTHLNDEITDKTTPEGYQVIKIKIRMFSPHDVNVLMGMANFNKSPENFGDLYGTMLSSDGTYVIKFTGNTSNIKMGFTTITWENKYAKYFDEYKDLDNETKFLKFLKNEMHVSGISLYKVKSNGKVFEIKLNAAGTKAESNECGN